MTRDAFAVLGAVVGALESGDAGVIAPVLAPDAVVWHNDDGVELPAADAFGGLPRLHELVDGLRVEVIRSHATEDGLVARIELRGGVRSTRTKLLARNCVFLTVENGRLVRIDEYVDPTFSTQLGL